LNADHPACRVFVLGKLMMRHSRLLSWGICIGVFWPGLQLGRPEVAAASQVEGTLQAAGQEQNPARALPPIGAWRSMFDGKSLQGWRKTPFAGHGKVHIESEAIVLQ
jgi:hypothetical protein